MSDKEYSADAGSPGPSDRSRPYSHCGEASCVTKDDKEKTAGHMIDSGCDATLPDVYSVE